MLKTKFIKIFTLSILIAVTGFAKQGVGVFAVDDQAIVLENSEPTHINVLANDNTDKGTDIIAVTQPNNGFAVNDGSDIIYQPNADYCNTSISTDDFTYTLTGGSTATVSVTVTCISGVFAPQLVPVNQWYWLALLIFSIMYLVKCFISRTK